LLLLVHRELAMGKQQAKQQAKQLCGCPAQGAYLVERHLLAAAVLARVDDAATLGAGKELGAVRRQAAQRRLLVGLALVGFDEQAPAHGARLCGPRRGPEVVGQHPRAQRAAACEQH
tara:strand:- start:197 stop:547 length:351 start_codon:yes stop_codon:yes gene_type:complete